MTRNPNAVACGLCLTASLILGGQYFLDALVLFDAGSNLYAQDNRYLYKSYADRKEGIVKSWQHVAGERLILVAAAIANSEARLPRDNTPYHLGFYLKDSAKVNIEIWEFEKLYKMEPSQNTWNEGPQQFSWPSEIPRYYNIAIKDLFPLAKIAGSHSQKIVPVVLYYDKPQGAEVCYDFCLVALDEIDTLKFKVYDVQTATPQPIYQGTLRDQRAHARINVRWPGKDQNNRAVKNGWYCLFLEAKFKARPPVNSKYQFYHHAGLLREERFK
jgi:hypothetical protein